MRVSTPPNKVIAGRYELVQAAGVGGMGTVWRGIAHGDGGFTRTVAIKRMLILAQDEDEPAEEMFIEEARVVSELSHPNIVQVFDFCTDDEGRYVIVMEWVEGIDLGRLIRAFSQQKERTPWPIVTVIVMEVLKALHAAHTRRDRAGRLAPVFHRDITPTNVLVGLNGVAKLTDFGLARAMDRASITPAGVLKGKLPYMAPEYVGGGKPSAAADQYSAGVLLWEALAGRRMREDSDPVRLFARVAAPIPPLTDERNDLPTALIDTVEQCLALEPAHRFESCRAMARSLATVMRDERSLADDVSIGRVVELARKRIGLSLDVPEPDGASPADVDETSSPSVV